MGTERKDKLHLVAPGENAKRSEVSQAPSLMVPASALVVSGLAHGGPGLQAKLDVGRAGDPAEVEADRMADAAVAELHPGHAPPTNARVQRKSAAPATAVEVGAAGGALSPAMEAAITSARGAGVPLSSPLRGQMEGALGADLSAVRVHTGQTARDLAAGISAHAFTIGSDVFFRDGAPDASRPDGAHLLAHELAHVVQQNPGTVGRSTIRRNEESAKLLTELASPKVFEGPEVKLQDDIVKKLDEKTPLLTKETDAKRNAAWNEFTKWDNEFKEAKHTEEEMRQHGKDFETKLAEHAARYPKFESQELYLGSVVLSGVPASADDDEKLLAEAKLEVTDNAFKPGQNGYELSLAAGVAPDIVRNTLQTMIKAKQIEYLRKSGFIGKGWKIIVEVHYIRNRPSSAANFHKDTLGQTLFVNLNYQNKEDIAGPEYVINPPLVATHEAKIAQNLPGEFMSDLKETRKAYGTPTEIKSAGTLKPNSVVAFVDEAIHHSTPLAGHRSVKISKLKQFLEKEPPFSALYKAALAAFTESITPPTPTAGPKEAKSGGWMSSIFGSSKSKKPAEQPPAPKSFAQLFNAGTENEKLQWEALMRICAQGDDKTVDRTALAELMTEEQANLLLSEYGPDTFNTVSIPPSARTDPEKKDRIPMRPDQNVDRKIPLTREASRKDFKTAPVAGKNKEESEEGPKRTFFRTWVRAVKA
jgi:hypothetical protein